MQIQTKPMKRYLIEYLEAGEIHQWTCKAHDKSHAAEKFCDPEEGVTSSMIRSIKTIK